MTEEEAMILTALREGNHEQLGVQLSCYFYDRTSLLDVCQAAIEDANMHSLNCLIDTWREEKGV